MRKRILSIAACGLLCGCAASGELLKDSYSWLFKTEAQIEAEDSAKCESYGANPGTDVYVQCMVGFAQIRATNAAASSSSAPPAPRIIQCSTEPGSPVTTCN
jgi:hypothetical protein